METKDLAFFPRLILEVIRVFTPDERWQRFYLRWMNFMNYAVVCGIGVIIYSTIFRGFIGFWWANMVAGFTAFLWLYVMTVGPFRYLWGFRPKPPRKEKRENER